ncbi:MAG: hypothetical protein OXI88_12190 [Gammaproteobacteria bacterium]|nr:hypothetical protein [Gammaproteobacteria bacterium]
MTITAEFGSEAYPPHLNDVPYKPTIRRQPDEETTPSLQVTPPSRRIRTDRHLPGFGFQAELQRAVKPHTDTLTALDVLKNDPTLLSIDDTLQHIQEPSDAVDEIERFLKKTGLYQVQKFMDDLNRPFH